MSKMGKFFKLAMPDSLGLRNDKGQFTSEGFKGENNLYWNKSGEHQRKDGRWIIRVNGVWQLRDRTVVEAKLGRKLTKFEIVHHINGNKEDDRLENLQVIDRVQHRHLHPSMDNKPRLIFNSSFLREQLKTKSQNQLAKELKCTAGVIKRNLGEKCRW